MKKIRIGLIGAGGMGRAHTIAYKNLTNFFGNEIVPELVVVADVNEAAAAKMAETFGYQRSTGDWMSVVTDPEIDLIDITTPNASHCPIAIEAAKNGKNVYCEKPLAMDAEEARNATAVTDEAGIITAVGFNYLCNPIQVYVRDLIASGALGKVVDFRGTFDQDYYNEPDQKHEWRMFKSASASGALGDLASHTISLSQFLVGDVDEVCGMTSIVVPERPDPKDPSRMLPVENDDDVHFMMRYKNGAIGTIMSNRLASGRKLSLTYEIQLTNGSIVYTQERQNEVQIYRHDDDKKQRGFKTVYAVPGHGDFDKFYPAGAGFGMSYSDLKVIEVHNALSAAAENKPYEIDFHFATKIMEIIDAVLESAETRSWVKVGKA